MTRCISSSTNQSLTLLPHISRKITRHFQSLLWQLNKSRSTLVKGTRSSFHPALQRSDTNRTRPGINGIQTARCAEPSISHEDSQSVLKNLSTMAENTKPQQLTKDAKWQDWVPTFLEFLRNIAARNGGNERRLLVVLAFGLVSAILLQYSVRPHELPDYMHQTNFILYWWR